MLFATEDKLTPECLPEQLHTAPAGEFRCVIPPYFTMEEIEREAIAQTLERTGGNIKRTAEILKYHRPRLYRKMKSFGLRGGADTDDRVPWWNILTSPNPRWNTHLLNPQDARHKFSLYNFVPVSVVQLFAS